MGKKLYVGNLPFSATDQVLSDTFSQCGNVVSAIVIMDNIRGRSKGFGFVEMSTDEEAANAISMFNGKDMEGRMLTVNEAKPMEPKAPRQGGYSNRGGDRGGDRGGRSW